MKVTNTDVKEDKPQHTKLVEKFCSIVSSGELEDSWPTMSQQTNLLLLALVASAKKDGAWITPRGAGKSIGREPVQAEIKAKKARFGKVARIKPDSKGLNLEVKVVEIDNTSGDSSECVALVGDDSGVVKLRASREQVTENGCLVIRNAFVRMVKGTIELRVDKWGKLELSKEDFTFTPNKDKNVSATEYELVK